MRDKILQAANGWIGTPYHHRAMIKGVGVDCAQLLIACYSEAGLTDKFDTGEYAFQWMLHKSDELFLANLQERLHQVETPKPGDIVIYKYGRCFSHAAIVVDWPLIIHASRPDKMVCYADGDQGDRKDRERLFFSYWG